jgi:hypothetical protein
MNESEYKDASVKCGRDKVQRNKFGYLTDWDTANNNINSQGYKVA